MDHIIECIANEKHFGAVGKGVVKVIHEEN